MQKYLKIALIVISMLNFLISQRPDPSDRKFVSPIIDKTISEVKSIIKDDLLSTIFENCYPNTLDTTIDFSISPSNIPDTFVITGDIEAMWQRDSTNKVLPYVRFASKEENLKNMIKGVINRQVKNVKIDAYANAFNKNEINSPWQSDETTKIVDGKPVKAMNKHLWERKYEIDSIAAFLKLSNEYYKITKDKSIYDNNWFEALKNVLNLIEEQTLGTLDEDLKGYPAYTFQRTSDQATETTIHGRGSPSKKIGLVKSYFRPSDDACLLPFNIPGNAMLSVELGKAGEILSETGKSIQYSKILKEKSKEIKDAIYTHGVITDKFGKLMFAYEVDGFGSYYLMDDANSPSLLSLPFLDFIDKNDPIYLNTRKFVLSNNNPYFYEGKAGFGIGGPHNGNGWIWPMIIIIQALTSNNDKEIIDCLKRIINNTGEKNFIHESFWRDDDKNFTRSWFAWANTLFGELIVNLWQEKPELLKNFKN